MKILGKNPKKTSWQLHTLTYPDGRVEWITGNCNPLYGQQIPYKAVGQVERKGAVYAQTPNMVFEATLEVVGYSGTSSGAAYTVMDKDTKQSFEITAGSMFNVLHCLQTGDLAINNGGIEAQWTFEKTGNSIYLVLSLIPEYRKNNELNTENALRDEDVESAFKP